MPSADWCVWCNKVLRGKVSYFHGLCYKCRNTKEGRQLMKASEEEHVETMLKLKQQRRR